VSAAEPLSEDLLKIVIDRLQESGESDIALGHVEEALRQLRKRPREPIVEDADDDADDL
jgi:hypothetical protein